MDTTSPVAPLLPLLAAIASAIASPALAQTAESPPRVVLERQFDHVRDVHLCTRPFERRGSVVMRAGYSGVTGEFVSPPNAILRIDRVRTTLRARLARVGARDHRRAALRMDADDDR